jgi:hypothetical protein
MSDLTFALELLPDEVWFDATSAAVELDAVPVLATALKYTPEGAALAQRLGIADQWSIDALIRVSQVPLAEGFHELASTEGLRGKLRLLLKELAPSAEFMRWWSPLARRGQLGLTVSYLWRPLWFVWRALPAYIAWRRARRRATNASGRLA